MDIQQHSSADLFANMPDSTETHIVAKEDGEPIRVQSIIDNFDNTIDHNATEIYTSANDGDLVRMQSLIDYFGTGFDINAKDEHGKTALCYAAEQGHVDVIRLLLSFNPDVNIPEVSTQKI